MAKRRVCESCLYFESAGFSKNGWCHHPSRRQNSDVRLIVRANELGCRNGWNADLWVPASTEATSQNSQPLESIGGRARSEVEPAEQSDLITSIVAAKTGNLTLPDPEPTNTLSSAAPIEEDIFVRQTPSLSWNTGPISSQPATELVQNPKAAILRARDQFRQRRKNEGRLADQQFTPAAAPLVASAREARMLEPLEPIEPEPEYEVIDPRYENRPILRPDPIEYDDRRPVSPVSLREIERPFPSMTDFPEDRARFESVPSYESPAIVVDEDAFVDQRQDDTWIETRQIDTVPPEPYEVDELFEEDEISAYAEAAPYEEEELSVRHRESVLNRILRHRRERRQIAEAYDDFEDAPAALVTETIPVQGQMQTRVVAPESSSVPIGTASDATSHRLLSEPKRTRRDEHVYRASPESGHRSEPRKPIRPAGDLDDDFVLPPPLPEFVPSMRVEQSSPAQPRPRIETDRSVGRSVPRERIEPPIADEFGDQPLFASSPAPPVGDYAPDRPSATSTFVAYRTERICQTCRDFRPSENAERGWCNNKWAFNHRRMVDADDLACRNSLGSWWTPKDDFWRRDGDISRHAQQTPRVDQWLLGTQSDDDDRRRSGS